MWSVSNANADADVDFEQAEPVENPADLQDPGDVCAEFDDTSTPSEHHHTSPLVGTPHSNLTQSARRSSAPSSGSHHSGDNVNENQLPGSRRGSMPSNALQQSSTPPQEGTDVPQDEYDQHHYTNNSHHSVRPYPGHQYDAEGDHEHEDDTQASAESLSRMPANSAGHDIGNQELVHAAEGYESVEINNPFYLMDSDENAASKLVLFSKEGPLPLEEKMALQDIATSEGASKARVLRRFVETVLFQRHLLTTVKDNEVNLFNSALNGELRRYSVLERERMFAIDSLVQELDKERENSVALEQENIELKRKLEEAEKKNIEVESYYSNYLDNFKLGDEVIPALERANDGVEQFRRESAQLVEEKNTQIEDYASRLLKMVDIETQSRRRLEQVEAENHQLRANFDPADISAKENIESDTGDTPVKRVVYTPPKDSEKRDLQERINELEFEIDNLQVLKQKADEDRKKVDDAFLSLNVDMETANSRIKTLQTQRDAAETKCHELMKKASEEKRKFGKLSNEMSKNIVQVVTELDRKESELRILRNDMDDRESALRSLQCNVKDLEDQLQALTDSALERRRGKENDREKVASHALVDTIIDSLRDDLSRAQNLLNDKSNELDEVKRHLVEQGESVISLQKEISRLEALNAVRRSSIPSPQRSDAASEEEAKFLRRLSVKLGCNSSNNRDLVEQLARRVETLVVQRAEFQDANETLKREVADRERALHSLRSEMQTDITALKAEAAHLENIKQLAQEERNAAEEKLLQVLNEPDVTRRDSLADLTVSSVGTRGWVLGDEGDLTSRRGSIFDGDDTIRWNDPVIDAAVQSVSNLIGTKDDLAARNRELREKLQNLLSNLPALDDKDGGASRAVIIQSKEFHEELASVVGLQQGIIDRIGQVQAERNDDSTLPYMRKSSEGLINAEGELISNNQAAYLHQGAGEATRFLNDQLAETRKLYSEKLKANVELCGLIDELREELVHIKSNNQNMECALSKLHETHNGFLSRLTAMTGVNSSVVALEDFVRKALSDLVHMHDEVVRKEGEERSLCKRLSSLEAQKRVLNYLISIYQTKYKLDILAPPALEVNDLRRRLRIRIFAVIALNRISKLKKLPTEDSTLSKMSTDYEVPDVVDITRPVAESIPLMDASLALAAVPRLEAAIAEKDNEISRLESSLESLNRSAALDSAEAKSPNSEMPQSTYKYEDDIVSRKMDLSRRLRKMINEKEELESALSREKQARLAVEAKVSKYMEKVAAYKRKLSKVSSQAESRESAYKAAVRYLKNKADKAVANDFDENVAPWDAKTEKHADTPTKEPNAASRAMLESNLANAEADLRALEPQSPAYEEMVKYVEGLRRAIQVLGRTVSSGRRPPRPSQSNANNTNRIALPN